ncbi:MAG TPA: hypothetical protein DCQ99_10090 [Nitrospinae bacterium]|nr:hypothetical protein [Nitrospinota bacterium]HBA27020.1 hypothetical protein [Nitrospinota bacterium]
MAGSENIIKNEIIAHLEELPANTIYTLATGQYVTRGFEYYKKEKLLYFEWSEDHQVLEAKVQGSRLYSVSILIENNNLNYRCSCPAWSSFGNCKHVICTLITIKNILNPTHFSIGTHRSDYKDSLKTSLLSISEEFPKKGKPSHINPIPVRVDKEWKNSISTNSLTLEAGYGDYSIIIERGYFSGHFTLSLQRGDKLITPYSSYNIPMEIRWIVRESHNYYYDSDKRFLEYLQQYENTHPLFLKIKDKKIPVEWNSSLSFSSVTTLNAAKGIVTLNRLCISDDMVCPNPYLICNDIVADLENKRLGNIKDRKGWRAWKLFMQRMKQDDIDSNYSSSGIVRENDFIEPIQIPVSAFQKYQFSIPEEYKSNIQLKVGDELVSPLTAEPHYSITIEQDKTEREKMILRAWCNIEGLKDSPTKSFFIYLKYFGDESYLSSHLRAKKRRAILIKTFLTLLSTKQRGKADKIIKDFISTDVFHKRRIRFMAKQCLTDALSSLNAESSRLQFYNGKWYVVRNDRARESLLYTIPSEIFGIDIFNGIKAHNEMRIYADELYKHLSVLYLKLKKHNIPLFFKGKPVHVIKWEFSFDCTRESGIDWFEIKPEIQCSGKLVDNKSWQMALKQDGVVEEKDFIQILDSNSQQILKTIAGIAKENNNAKEKIREIVRVPRLQILDWIHLRNMGVKVRLSKEDEDLIERLNRFEKIEERPIPENLKANLRHYQKDAYYWLSFLYEHRFGACLADDMGLGKTIQAITLLAGIKEGKVKPVCPVQGPHLLVLPPSLLFNWENEIGRFYPDLKIHFYTGLERTTEFKDCDVFITTYGLIRRDIERLKKIQFNVIIFDEAQAVKNIYADVTGAVRQLNGYFKLTMTGTPLENHLGEYYSILDLSLPGLLGEYDNFKSYIKLDTSPSLELILRRTRPFVLRRTKEKILKELPPKTESDIYLELTDKQKVLYKKTVEMIRSTIDEAYHTKTTAQAQIIALTAILKLRQLCVHPKLLDPTMDEPSPKIEFLISKLRELIDEKHSALVFSQFTSFLNILEDVLKKSEMPFSRLDGSTAVKKRKGLVEGFQDCKEASIFLLSLKAGGQGLNLTRASYVFHLDPWWNPAVENQASDRAHRIGQKNKVSIMRILMRHTIEEKMMELKKKKLELYKTVMDDTIGKKRGLSISKSDFDYLLA